MNGMIWYLELETCVLCVPSLLKIPREWNRSYMPLDLARLKESKKCLGNIDSMRNTRHSECISCSIYCIELVQSSNTGLDYSRGWIPPIHEH
jgi:hypothetical protein